MRVPRILWLYHLREIILYGALAFTAICTVMVSQNLLRALDDLVAVGFSFSDLRAVLGCLIPMLTAYAVPISFLFGVLAAMGRFSSDGEITAMRACGVRLRHLVAPALLLSLAVSALTAHLMIRVEHQARRELRPPA